MADEPTTNEAAPEEAGKSGGLSIKVIGIVLAIMIVEAIAVVLFVGSMGPFASNAASDVALDEPQDQTVEIEVAKAQYQNNRTQQQWLWEVEVYLKVSTKHEERVRGVLESRQREITAEIGKIIGSAKHAHLREPGHETISKQMGHYLDTVFQTDSEGRSFFEEVIVARCNGFRVDG